jgi:hypothetical protein
MFFVVPVSPNHLQQAGGIFKQRQDPNHDSGKIGYFYSRSQSHQKNLAVCSADRAGMISRYALSGLAVSKNKIEKRNALKDGCFQPIFILFRYCNFLSSPNAQDRRKVKVN